MSHEDLFLIGNKCFPKEKEEPLLTSYDFLSAHRGHSSKSKSNHLGGGTGGAGGAGIASATSSTSNIATVGGSEA